MSQILIVDNNEHITTMFQEVLSRQGHNITLAESGKAAMELIDKNHFDIAFVDLELTDTSGLDVLCYLRNTHPDTVTAVISGRGEINYAIESIKAGVFRYLKKPFDIEDILEVTNQLIQESNKRHSSIIGQLTRFSSRHLLKLSLDLLMLLLALFSGFLIQQKIYHWQEIPIIWGLTEVVCMLLSFACCYSFIFLTSYGFKLRESRKDFRGIFKSFTASYVLFSAILFFVTDFIYGRLALLSGFILGIAGLWLSREIFMPYSEKALFRKSEGPKKIILKGLLQEYIKHINPEETDFLETPAIEKERLEETTRVKTVTHRFANTEPGLGDDWGSRLIREFRANRLKQSKRSEQEKVEQMK